jgi:hypothetical protein
VGFWIPYGVLKTVDGTGQWRIPFAIQIIPAGVRSPSSSRRIQLISPQGCIIGIIFLTETPRFMVRKHGEAQGKPTSTTGQPNAMAD